ncbi:hypothetical protein F2Q68_00005422 [Brassica cretica]|uniref:Uncharacterized protein n=1 Tax=Brassica cretica TaxID=69181 RepID=A0A8S9JLY6_BRACR|nr:hypothetical protein F2Q68_00005422 [Brassica cretica]
MSRYEHRSIIPLQYRPMVELDGHLRSASGSQNGDHRRRNKNGAFSGAPSEPLHYQPPERLPKKERGMRKER